MLVLLVFQHLSMVLLSVLHALRDFSQMLPMLLSVLLALLVVIRIQNPEQNVLSVQVVVMPRQQDEQYAQRAGWDRSRTPQGCHRA
jgi:hypothetical protein